MRTKLDEIVECLPPEWRRLGSRVADLAFQHGADRAMNALKIAYCAADACITPEKASQPAPADDPVKEMGERLMQTADGTHPDLDTAPAEEKCGPHPTYLRCDICGSTDRRKGERRLFTARVKVENSLCATGGWFYVKNDDTLYRDRRSGKDRRK